MADLGAIEEDVPFDFGAASALASACDAAASSVDGQAGSRAGFVLTGLSDFTGHFADLFSDNAATAAGDASELAERLREVASGVRQLSDEARKEQQRRETARKWKHDHDNRNIFEKGWDAISGGDDPPVGPPASPVAIEVAPSTNRSRQTPAPGSGGGGSTTTSARPSNLRSFATSSKGANDDLRPKPGILRADYSTFTATCQWGTLDASGVFAGFDKWLAANDQDVSWATVVANAFAAAGGEGNVSALSNSSIAAALKGRPMDETRRTFGDGPYGRSAGWRWSNDSCRRSSVDQRLRETGKSGKCLCRI